MKILRLHLRNLNSLFGEVELDFTQPPFLNAGLFAIIGDTGAGKTTLLDAITLAIYGKIHRFRKENVEAVVSFSAKEASASVEFEARGRVFRAQWAMETRTKRDKTTEAKIARTFSDITAEEVILSAKDREIERLVVEKSGLTFEQFTKSVLLAQGDFAAFLRADEKERSELLEQITGTEIYTELGKKTFEQHKNYKQTLEIKQAEWRGLKLLTEAEIWDLKEKIKNLTDFQLKNTKTLTDFDKKLGIWTDFDKINQDWQAFLVKKEALAVAETNFETAKLQLQRHEQAQPFQPNLSELAFLTTELNMQENEAKTLENALKTAENTLKIAAEAAEIAATALAQAQKNYKTQAEKIAAARQLDTQISERAAPLVQWQTAFLAAAESRNAAEKEKATLTKKQKENALNIEKINNWLSQNDFSALAHEVKTIEFAINLGKAAFEKTGALRKNYSDKKEKMDATKADILKNEAELVEETAELARVKAVLQDFEAAGFHTQQDFTDKQDKIRQKIIYANDLLTINTAYDAVLETAERQKDDLETAHNTLNIHCRQLLARLDEAKHYDKNIKLRAAQLEALRFMQSHEAARAQLKANEPCPLCGAVEHPFADYEVSDETLVIAENELIILNEKLELSEEKQRRCENIISSTIPVIENLEEKMYETRDKIIRCEMELGEKLGYLGADMTLRKADILQKRKKAWEAEQQALGTQKDKFIKTKDIWQNTEKAIFSRNSALEILTVRYNTENDALTEIAEQGKQHKNILDEQTAVIHAAFAQANTTNEFAWATADAILLDLQQNITTYTTQKTALENALQAQAIVEIELKNAVTNFEKYEKNYTEISTQGDDLKTALLVLEKQRADMLGAITTDAAQATADHLLHTAQQEYDAKKSASTAALQQQTTQAELLKNQQKRCETTAEKQSICLEKIEKQVAKSKFFENIAAVKSALLSEAQVADFITQQQHLTSQKAVLESTETTLLAQQTALAKATENLSPQTELQVKQQEIKTQLLENQANITVFEYQLSDNESRQLSAKALVNELEKIELTTRRWSSLNVVIGDATGAKFRKFAQGLTLQRLVVLANKHLEELNPRYRIRKDERASLELMVQDTYQANFERSMQTLSGGESFLVSLALALGLSDMAGNNTRIESLFIDEGFGTLDAESLNAALSALESLQSTGKLIGIISHVPELKERITAKIHVTKQGNGRSLVSLK
jgi:DNA repair protein SbcC/Rad50